jgi:hypothetical protein
MPTSYFSILKMEAIYSSETAVHFHRAMVQKTKAFILTARTCNEHTSLTREVMALSPSQEGTRCAGHLPSLLYTLVTLGPSSDAARPLGKA